MMRALALLCGLRRYLADTTGIAAFEVALWLAALIPALLNIVDLGTYAVLRMQVENAAQVAAQAAWAKCETPPTSNCAGFIAAIDAAITASTSLGANVTQFGSPVEGYYCPDIATGDLVSNGGSATCGSGAKAGYYVQLTVTYPYQPVFADVSVASLLTTPITKTVWTRLK